MTDERRFGGGDESRVQALMAEVAWLRRALQQIVREAELAPMEDGIDAGGIARGALNA